VNEELIATLREAVEDVEDYAPYFLHCVGTPGQADRVYATIDRYRDVIASHEGEPPLSVIEQAAKVIHRSGHARRHSADCEAGACPFPDCDYSDMEEEDQARALADAGLLAVERGATS